MEVSRQNLSSTELQENINAIDKDNQLISDSTFKINYSSYNYNLIDSIKNNHNILILEIDMQNKPPDFLEQDAFYVTLNEAKNLFFVDVSINESTTDTYDEILKTKLKAVNNQLIIQCRSSSVTKIYFKEASKEPIVLDLRPDLDKQFSKDDFNKKLPNKDDFGLSLIVEGLKLGYIGNFNGETDRSLTKVTFKTKTNIEEEDHNYTLNYWAITHDHFLLVRLLSLYYQDLSTLNPNDPSELLKIAAKDSSFNTLVALLKLKFPLPTENIHLSDNVTNLLNISSKYNLDTPLSISVRAGKKDKVDFFIQCGVDINKKCIKCAIDIAWENEHYDIVLTLLKANSNLPEGVTIENIYEMFQNDTEWGSFFDNGGNLNIHINKEILKINLAWKMEDYDVVLSLLKAGSDFPEGFSLKTVHEYEEWKKFFDNSKLHTLIKEGKFDEVKKLIVNNKSKYFLNVNKDFEKSESALLTAIKAKQYDIYAFLKSKGLHLMDEEQKYINDLKSSEKEKLKNALISYFPPVDDAHILYLLSKSKSSEHNKHFRQKVEDLYKKLDNIPEISIILKVIQYCDNINIIFDFTKESIIGIDPTSEDTTKGRCLYEKGTIYIGAKNDEELAGTLAHELTHLAMYTVYNNNCNPYSRKSDIKESNYKQLIKDIGNACEPTNSHIDDIIKRVFKYEESDWASELIVRVPHILAKYGKTKGEELLKEQASSLLQYYKENVISKSDDFVNQGFLIKAKNSIQLFNQYSGLIDSIIESKIQLNKNIDLNNFLNLENNIHFLILKTKSTLLSNINVYQFLKETTKYSSPDSYLFLKFNTYKKNWMEFTKSCIQDLVSY